MAVTQSALNICGSDLILELRRQQLTNAAGAGRIQFKVRRTFARVSAGLVHAPAVDAVVRIFALINICAIHKHEINRSQSIEA